MPTDNPGDLAVGEFFGAGRIDRRLFAEPFWKPQGRNGQPSGILAGYPVHGQVRKRVPDYTVARDILAVQQLEIIKEQGGDAQKDAGQSRPLKQFLRQRLGASQVTWTIRD